MISRTGRVENQSWATSTQRQRLFLGSSYTRTKFFDASPDPALRQTEELKKKTERENGG